MIHPYISVTLEYIPIITIVASAAKSISGSDIKIPAMSDIISPHTAVRHKIPASDARNVNNFNIRTAYHKTGLFTRYNATTV